MQKITCIPSELLTNGKLRLDASYYNLSGAKEIKMYLENSSFIKVPLYELTSEGTRGIFIPNRFKRVFVTNPDNGYRLLGGEEINSYDIVNKGKYLSKKFTFNVDELMLKEDTIVITRSGTIGKVGYIAKGFKDLLGSEHLLRVITDPCNALSGFLYAFFCSSIGQRLLKQNTFGSVVQHIEPENLYNIPVPYFEKSIMENINNLIYTAFSLRYEAYVTVNTLISEINNKLASSLGWLSRYNRDHQFACSKERSEDIIDRLDAYYYTGYISDIRSFEYKNNQYPSLNDLGYSIYSPNIFKAVFGKTGYPYHTGITVYSQNPKTDRFLSFRMKGVKDYIVDKPTILIQSAGQRYGLLGTPVYTDGSVRNFAATSDLIRIQHESKEFLAFAYCFLYSEFGQKSILQHSYGTSIPHINVKKLGTIQIPFNESEILNIGSIAVKALENRIKAIELEDQAISMIEKEIG